MNPAGPQRIGWRSWLGALALLAIVWGVRIDSVGRFATDLPMWDQWDAEGETLFRPWLEGRLTAGDFFRPHNEHRIVPSKLLGLFLVATNGQWDNRLECVVNAGLYAVIAAAVFLAGCRRLRGGWRIGWFCGVALLAAPPLAWHNVISGFHSQQYFLIGFSIAGVALLTTSPQFTRGWIFGVLACAGALVSMGSGLLAPAAVIALLAVDAKPREVLRRHGVTLAVCVVLVVIGWSLRVTTAAHDPLRAGSVTDFVLTFWRSLQWPATPLPWFPLLLWAPWARLTWRVLRRAPAATGGERAVVAVGAWVLLQFLATAYARGAGGPWPANRYLDTVVVGVGANVFASLILLSRADASRRGRWFDAAVLVLALGFFQAGWRTELRTTYRDTLPMFKTVFDRRERNTRGYLATGDAVWMPNNDDIAYPNIGVLTERLAHPAIRALMPASVRAPLPLAADASAGSAFAVGAVPEGLAPTDGATARGSYTEEGVARTGAWRSQPLPVPSFAYWQVRLAGDAGSLTLAAPDGAELQQLAPLHRATTGWQIHTVTAPDGPSVLTARDEQTEGWLAFQAPVEMGAGSWWAARAAQSGKTLAWLGGVIAVACLGFGMAAWWRIRQRSDRTANAGASAA